MYRSFNEKMTRYQSIALVSLLFLGIGGLATGKVGLLSNCFFQMGVTLIALWQLIALLVSIIYVFSVEETMLAHIIPMHKVKQLILLIRDFILFVIVGKGIEYLFYNLYSQLGRDIDILEQVKFLLAWEFIIEVGFAISILGISAIILIDMYRWKGACLYGVFIIVGLLEISTSSTVLNYCLTAIEVGIEILVLILVAIKLPRFEIYGKLNA